MRPTIAVFVFLSAAAAVAHADVSSGIASSSTPPPAQLRACVAAVDAALRKTYPADRRTSEDNFCSVETTKEGVTFDCDGACIDRNCHNDACDDWDRRLEVSLTVDGDRASSWTRSAEEWKVTWERQVAGVRASVVQHRYAKQRAVRPAELWLIRRTIDLCLRTLR